jgi:hypothetical protein
LSGIGDYFAVVLDHSSTSGDMDVGYLTCRPTNPSTYLGGVFDPAEPPSKARRNRLLQPFGFEDTYSAGIYTLRSVLET